MDYKPPGPLDVLISPEILSKYLIMHTGCPDPKAMHYEIYARREK